MRATATRPVAVEELRRAWHAVQDGAFRSAAHRPSVRRTDGHVTGSDPAGPILPVVGVVPQAGASTLALAMATIRGGRVVECCTATASGLATAVTAEMGVTASGWVIGRREGVHIARTSAIHRCLDEIPVPEDVPAGTGTSVLDVGWDLGQVLTGDGWLTASVLNSPSVLLVTTVNVPGLRRLEVAADLLGIDRVVVAARGSDPRRWPRQVRGAAGDHARALHAAGRWVALPHERDLAVRGLDSTPLPRPLLAVAEDLWRRCDVTGHRTKEEPS